MSVLAKVRRKYKGIPEIPPALDDHPQLQQHLDHVRGLEARRDATHAAIAALEEERQRVDEALAEAKVVAVLGEDAGADARVSAGS